MPIRVEVQDVGTLEFPDDTPDDVIDAAVQREVSGGTEEPGLLRRVGEGLIDYAPTIGGIAGGTAGLLTGPAAPIVSPVLAGLGGAAGSAVQQIAETLTGERGDTGQVEQLREMAGAGAEQGAAQLGGQVVGAGAKLLARPLMRVAMGAQTATRNKFPTVDLEGVAIREGTSPQRIRALSRRAGEAVPQAGRAADAAGAAPVTFGDVRPALQQLHQRATRARLPETAQQISQEAGKLRRAMGTGVSVEDALAMKSARQTSGRSALPSATDPRAASTSADIDAAVAKALAQAARSRSPGVGPALTRSQELMALQRALKNAGWAPTRTGALVGAGIGSGTGFGSGDASTGLNTALLTAALSSPRGAMTGARAVAQSAPALREATRLAILALLGEDEPENNDARDER